VSAWVGRARRILRSRRELARLNHVLLPEKKPDRDRLRKGWGWKLVAPAFVLHGSLSREGRALFLLTLMIGFAGLDVMGTQVYLLFSFLAGLLIASVAMRPFYRAKGLSVRATSAPRVEVGAPLEILVHLANAGARPLLSLRVSGPFLPWDGRWLESSGGVAAVDPGREATVVTRATFLARGEHHLDPFDAGALVPLGLAIGPRRLSDGVRFLVVPKIAKIGRLELTHRRPAHTGEIAVRRAAGESEIEGVRPYRPGDPLKHLHARTWARTGVPHVRTYAAESSVRTGLAVLVDGNDASERAKEAAISVAAGVAARLSTAEGLDLCIVDGAAHRIAPRLGRPALETALDRLAVHQLVSTDADVTASVEERASSLSALVLVTADVGPKRSELVRDLESRGLSVRWLVVLDPDAAPAARPERATFVAIDDVEADLDVRTEVPA
jgi:uncharacterized protein (DUF58 family)